jgi:hypothetical protein
MRRRSTFVGSPRVSPGAFLALLTLTAADVAGLAVVYVLWWLR